MNQKLYESVNPSPTSRGYLKHQHCLLLYSMGLTQYTEAYWVIDGSHVPVVLHRDFDPLNLYVNIDDSMLPENVTGSKDVKRIPAYLVSDLMTLLPELLIRRDNGNWFVSAGLNDQEFSATHSDLNEALFIVTLYYLKMGWIDLKAANHFIHYQIQYNYNK